MQQSLSEVGQQLRQHPSEPSDFILLLHVNEPLDFISVEKLVNNSPSKSNCFRSNRATSDALQTIILLSALQTLRFC